MPHPDEIAIERNEGPLAAAVASRRTVMHGLALGVFGSLIPTRPYAQPSVAPPCIEAELRDNMPQTASTEPILEPRLPIIDSHHHLWFMPESAIAAMEHYPGLAFQRLVPMYRAKARYLFDEFLADASSGHNVVASVYVDAHSMLRASGPDEMRSVGEVEFVNGVAAMAASGLFGDFRACAAIVGGVDLSIGARVEDVLAAHVAAGNGRYRGVRSPLAHADDDRILGTGVTRPRLALDQGFRAGFAQLDQFGLSFDAWLFEPQLPELVALAHDFPQTPIILNHVGGPLLLGHFGDQRAERFAIWREQIRALAVCPNMHVKLGGLGVPFGDFPSFLAEPRFTSAQLAAEWRPYIETCIETFGADRCMFESNFPVDWSAGDYATIWNAFKRITHGASPDEKTALYSGTAARVYRIDLPVAKAA